MADIPVNESTAETVVVVTANGQTTFAFDFLIFAPEQMAVLHGRGDVETVLTYPADFSVSGLNEPNGGTVTLNVATLANDVITMRRVTPIERTSDWQAEGDYKAALVNREQDTMFMIMQEISRDTGKAVAEVSLMDGRITLEQQLRIAADDALGGRVDKEISDRAAAVSNEAYLREAGDKSVASLIGQAGPIETQVYDTRTAAELSVVKETIQTIRTGGFFAAGDGGGALYKRSPVEPSHDGKFQSADGAWWEIADRTITPQMFGAVGSGDHAEALQRFFDYLKVSRVPFAEMSGAFNSSQPLVLDLLGGATEYLHFNCTIQAQGANEGFLLRVNRAIGTVFTGKLELLGTGGEVYTDRTWGSAIKVDGSARANFYAQITGRYFKYYNLFVEGYAAAGNVGNGSLASFGAVRSLHCGSTTMGNGTKPPVAFTARTDTGSAGSHGQRSVLTVDELPSAAVRDDNPIVVYNDYPYTVVGYDVNASTITVFPWLEGTATSGNLEYIEGAGVYVKGADANVLKFDLVEASNCAVGYRNRGLYGGIAERMVAQFCGVGIVAGNPPSSSSLQSTVVNPYFELNRFDIVQVAAADQKSLIINPTIIDLSKCYGTQPRLANGGPLSTNFSLFTGISILLDGVLLRPTGERSSGTSGSTTNLALGPAAETPIHIRSNLHTVSLKDSPHERRIFGYRTARCFIEGTGPGGTPTGTITVARDTGYTINGSASDLVLQGLPGPILLEALLVETDWLVSVVPLRRAGTPPTGSSQVISTDAAFTLTPFTSPPITRHTGTLTANRNVTLSTTGAVVGTQFKIIRTGGGAFTLNVGSGPLKAIAENTWAEFTYDGSAWYLSASGSL